MTTVDPGAALVFPIGHSLGPDHRDGGNTADQAPFRIRIGWETIVLPSDEHVDLWGLAHGRASESERLRWTRDDLVVDAVKAGIGDPASLVADLVRSGALVEVAQKPDALAGFAAAHRFEPLLVGLGNDQQEPLLGIGVPGLLVAAQVTPRVFEIWQWSHLWPDLLAASEGLAGVAAELGQSPDESDPGAVLGFALETVRMLVAHGAGYLDARREPAPGG